MGYWKEWQIEQDYKEAVMAQEKEDAEIRRMERADSKNPLDKIEPIDSRVGQGVAQCSFVEWLTHGPRLVVTYDIKHVNLIDMPTVDFSDGKMVTIKDGRIVPLEHPDGHPFMVSFCSIYHEAYAASIEPYMRQTWFAKHIDCRKALSSAAIAWAMEYNPDAAS